MVKFLINRPIGVLMSFFALILIGLYAATLIPVSLLPDIDIPEITVRVSYPSKSAAELEQSVVSSLRMQLLQVNGIDDVESETRDAESIIRMKFDYGVDIDMAFVEVNEKVDMAMADLPREVARPRVIKASATDLPVFNININYKQSQPDEQQMLDLSLLVSNVIRKRVEQLPDVALADITGTLSPEICITPNLGKMRSLGITHEQIATAINQNMIQMSNIRYREGQLVYDVQMEQKINQPTDINKIPIAAAGRIFRLDELATTTLRATTMRGCYMYNNKQSLCVPVIKSSNARMSDLKEEITKLIEQLRNEYPELDFNLSNDQTLILDLTIDNLRSSLIAGIILAISVMFLFIGDYRSPVLMGITIPVSLVVGMVFFKSVGLSLNIVSLSGMILGVGMMIDNAIVVIDNITQWRVRGSQLEEAVIKGTNEIILPLLSSMLTTCAVFIPLIFFSGIAGAMFFDQAVAITIGLAVSFMVSITLLPTLYYLLQRKNKESWHNREAIIPIEQPYEAGHRFVFGHLKTFIAITFILLIIPFWVFNKMGKSQMPELTRNQIVVNVSWGNNISLNENTLRCKQLMTDIGNKVDESALYIGRQSLILSKNLDIDEGDASIYLSTKQVDANTLQGIVKEWAQSNYPNSMVSFKFPESAFDRIFPAPDANLVVNVASTQGSMLPSQEQVNRVIELIRDEFPTLQVASIPTSAQIHVMMNTSNMLINKIEASSILSTLQTALSTNNIGSLAYEQQVLPIIYSDSVSSIESIINSQHISTPDSAEVPLRTLVSIGSNTSFRSIFGNSSNTYIPIYVNGDEKKIKQLHQRLSSYDVSTSTVGLSYSGEFFNSRKQTSELVVVLIVSVLLLYFILAAQFESIGQPIIVLLELPIDIGLALLLLWAFGGTLNLMSLIGIVVMGGIIVNDSILKIDSINRLHRGGMPLEAAIAEGGKRRLKSIVMTSLTTILALFPILIGHDIGSELQQPMAITLIAGMFVGTLVSLYVVPLIYWVVYRKK